MGGIKYYRLAKNEELPDEFCAVRDIGGEPSEYTWYERMSDSERELWVPFTQSDWFAGSEYRKLQVNNAKLRELVSQLIYCAEKVGNEDTFYYQPTRDGCGFDCAANGEHCSFAKMCDRARELGVEL